MKALKVWSITDGGAGMLSQSEGLARALNENFVRKNCKIKSWLRFLPVTLQTWLFPYILERREDFTSKPDIAIGVGRDSIPALRWIKKHCPQTFTIYGQNPGLLQAHHFDLVIATEHNYFKSKNTISTKFALHKLTKPILNKAAKEFSYLFKDKPKPWRSIVIGGKAPHYSFGAKETMRLIEDIEQIAKSGGSIFITPSRRTGQENIDLIEKALKKFGDQIYLYKYDQEEKNPYIGMLALSDELYITEDSVSMISEAC